MQQFCIRVAAMEGFPGGARGKESSGNEKKMGKDEGLLFDWTTGTGGMVK